MGKTGLYLKILLLVTAFVVVIFVMRSLSTEKVAGAFQALGIEPGATGQPGLQAGGAKREAGETARTLCQTRVHAIRFADGRAIVEKKKGMKLDWTAEEPVNHDAENAGKKIDLPSEEGVPVTSRSISYLEVEKWFSLHCQFNASPAPAPSEQALDPSNEPVKFAVIEFIDKTKWELYRSGPIFLSASDIKDRFVSPDLEQAFADLRAIAGFPVDSGDR